MSDMSQVIIPKSDQINAEDLISGDMTITIREVIIKGGQEQPVSIVFDGSDKVYRPCKTMSKLMVALWGPDAKAYVGRSLQLYRDPDVIWGALKVGGIRIRAMSHIAETVTLSLSEKRGRFKPHTVKPLAAQKQPAPDLDDKVACDVASIAQQIMTAATAEIVAAILAKPSVVKLRAWLPENRPELAAQIDTAISTAAGDTPTLAAADPSHNAGDAAAPAEGRGDADRGESTTLESAKAELDMCELEADVNARAQALRPLLSDSDADELAIYAGEVVERMRRAGS